MTYTITVTNAGPTDAVGAVVTDMFPAALTGVTWTCVGTGGGVCNPSGSGNINESVTVPVGGTVTFTATGTVSPAAVGVLVNTASVAPPPGASDPSSANNTDSDTLTPQADLAITKTGPASVVAGSNVVYTITVTNAGPSNAESVVVTDVTPAGLTWVSNIGDCVTAFPCALGTVLGRSAAAHDHGDLRGAGELHDARSDCEHRDGLDLDDRPRAGQRHGDGPDAAQSQRRRRGDQDGAGRPSWSATRSPSPSRRSTTARAPPPASR